MFNEIIKDRGDPFRVADLQHAARRQAALLQESPHRRFAHGDEVFGQWLGWLLLVRHDPVRHSPPIRKKGARAQQVFTSTQFQPPAATFDKLHNRAEETGPMQIVFRQADLPPGAVERRRLLSRSGRQPPGVEVETAGLRDLSTEVGRFRGEGGAHRYKIKNWYEKVKSRHGILSVK